jgi:hypothetical protein
MYGYDDDESIGYGMLSASQALLTPRHQGGGLGAAFGGFGRTVSRERQNQIDAELKKQAIEARRRELVIKPQQKFIPLGNGMLFNSETQEIISGPQKPEREPAKSSEIQLVDALYPVGHPQRERALQELHQKHATHAPFAPGVGGIVQTPTEQIVLDRSGNPVNRFAPKPNPTAAKAAEKAKTEAEKLATMDNYIAQAETLLPKATGSGIGNLRDMGTGFIGMSTEKDDVSTTLEMISGWMMGNVPRLEGPQSDADRINYMRQAADVGNRKKTISSRMAALKGLKEIRARALTDDAPSPDVSSMPGPETVTGTPSGEPQFRVIRRR